MNGCAAATAVIEPNQVTGTIGYKRTFANVAYRLRVQPVNATPPILTDKGLKPMAFLRRGLVAIRGCTSTSERDQGNSATNA